MENQVPGGPSPWAALATEAGKNKKVVGCQVPSLIHCLVLVRVAVTKGLKGLWIHGVNFTVSIQFLWEHGSH